MPHLSVVLGVAIPALGVWLVVRMINRGERWTKWTAAAALVAVLAYPLSFAPVIRLRTGPDWIVESDSGFIQFDFPDWYFETSRVYEPIGWLIDETPYRKLDQQWARILRVERTCGELSFRRRLFKAGENDGLSSQNN